MPSASSSRRSPRSSRRCATSVPVDPVPVRGLVALLLAYLTLPAVAALVAGSLLLRAQRAAQEGPAA